MQRYYFFSNLQVIFQENWLYLCAMKYKLVIFDLDGTLVDTIADLGAAANAALAAKGLPQHAPEAFRSMVGHGVRNLMKQAMPEAMREDEQALDALLEVFLQYYIEHIDERSRPYPGVRELLQELQAAGVELGVASNKFQAGAEKLVGRMFPEIRFAAILGGRPGVPLKPDPAIVAEIRSRAGVSLRQTLMVGDSATDMATATAAGVDCVAVSWGFRTREQLAAAPRIVDTAAELRALLDAE
jgi:phosphoglycolate phosphatase